MHKHHPLRVIVGLLLLGLATSVLVAWGFAWPGGRAQFDRDRAAGPSYVASTKHWMEFDAMRHPGGIRVRFTGYMKRGSLGGEPIVDFGTMPLGLMTGQFLIDLSDPWFWENEVRAIFNNKYGWQMPIIRKYAECQLSGWPARCLYRQRIMERRLFPNIVREVPAPTHWLEDLVPLRPYAAGLALNTAFYAALWGLVLFAFPAARRWNRRCRSLCARCGYDTARLATCPECGTGIALTSV